MIRFPCQCGHRFEAGDDEAGGLVQCPRCGILNDVPTLRELADLNPDGTIKLADAAPSPRAVAHGDDYVAEVGIAFGRSRVDAEGHEIDLRRRADDPVGGAPFDIDPARPARPDAPVYDPETGELVRPLDVARDERRDTPPGAIPLARPAIAYARGGAHAPQPRAGRVMLQLFQPGNAAVLVSVFLAHLGGAVLHVFIFFLCTALSAAGGFYVPAWPFNVLFWLALAHYGNVVREMGPEEFDELPRPLGMLGIADDILAPLGRVLAAFALCYWPAVLAIELGDGDAPRAHALPLLLAGSVAFPAVVLTTLTSGSLANLRPDRVLRVVAVGGARYAALAALWAVLMPAFLWAVLDVDLVGPIFGVNFRALLGKSWGVLMLPALMALTYFMHYFCWRLALLYRARHTQFGWVWQELFAKRDGEPLPRQRRPYVAPPAARADGIPSPPAARRKP